MTKESRAPDKSAALHLVRSPRTLVSTFAEVISLSYKTTVEDLMITFEATVIS